MWGFKYSPRYQLVLIVSDYTVGLFDKNKNISLFNIQFKNYFFALSAGFGNSSRSFSTFKLYPLSLQSINSLSRTCVSKFPCDDEFVFVLIKLMINYVGRHNSSELHQFSVNV